MPKKYFTLITGASEGFGKALSLECARRNMNLILVSLPGDELTQLGKYIETEFGVKVYCFAHDLSRKEDCLLLEGKIKELHLSLNILINNAGIGGSHLFHERNAEFYHRQIQLNVVAPTLLTHLFLENLQQNGPAHILNVCSLASFFYLPNKQVYGGTKSYLLSFSSSLGTELKGKKVYVTSICPGGMNTTLAQVVQNRKLNGISKWSVMNPEDVAKVAIEGMMKKKKLIIPGFWNRFFLLLNQIIPGQLKEKIMEQNLQLKIHQTQNTKHMKKISYWARNNKWKARLGMTAAWILLIALGIFIGSTLTNMNAQLPQPVLVIIIAGFLASIFFYPQRAEPSNTGSEASYHKRKRLDLLLAICSFCMVVFAANNPDMLFRNSGNLYAASGAITVSLPTDSSARTYKTSAEFSASMKDANGKKLKVKERKKLLKQQVKAIKASRDLSQGEKILLTFLSCIAAGVLLWLVAALSCSLSCNGSQAAAVIVGIGGAGLVILLLVLTIRNIYGKNKKKAKKQDQPVVQPAIQ